MASNVVDAVVLFGDSITQGGWEPGLNAFGEQLSPPKIRLLTIWYGANDSTISSSPHHVPLEKFASNLREWIDLVHSPNSPHYSPTTRIILISPPPVNADMRRADVESRNPPQKLDRDFEYTRKYAQAVREVAKDKNVGFTDVWTVLYEAAGKDEESLRKYLTDGLHLNRDGYQDGLYDVAWSEIHENQLVTASGDGSLRLWDVMLNDLPIRAWQEHTREVFSVDWSNIKKDTFASSSWDGTVKLVRDIPSLFSPHQPDILATCSTDGTVKIFDLRSPAYVSGPGTNNFTNPISAAALTVPASPGEVLTIDWNKYRPFLLASGGVDKLVNIWDCRMIKPGELNQVGGARETQLFGHEYAVRKVQWSPHRAEVLATASYDMTCRVSMEDEGTKLDPTDIFSSSLETLFDYQPITLASAGTVYIHEHNPPSNGLCATPTSLKITLRTPDTLAANWSLHASDVWASSRYLADHLDQLGLNTFKTAEPEQPVRVLELGAAAGLPGILIAKTFDNVSVVVSDYPDELLIKTLAENVERNGVADLCRAAPHAWGSDPSSLIGDGGGFDLIVAADTLWNPSLHDLLLTSLQMTLKKTSSARIHLVAGLHTGRYTIQSFLDAVQKVGFEVESATEKEVKGSQERAWNVARGDDDKERRRWVVWMALKWKDYTSSRL
ncbi:hypothetical protein DXG03_007788 [Asterophora parasitica]|uniref:Peroxin-7 n=1 Tax=Asterophora parasitica TaxID=117018 RepID=A0A9P7KFU6_9AGAR|nr:hypothetical protein DXG03_007788 [Asterophora parasitica]